VSILSAALAPIIAVGAAYIAYQNMRTAKHKIKIDLFEKRLKVYNNLKDVLDTLYVNMFPEDDPYLKYIDIAKEARWLYDQAMLDWMDANIGVMIRDVFVKNDEAIAAESEALKRLKSEMRKLRTRLVLSEHAMPDVFAKFLKIHEQ
jgi:hypothetical protein